MKYAALCQWNGVGWGGAENRMQPLKTKWLRPPWLLISDAPHPAPPVILKGDTKQRCKLAWKHRKCPNIFICRLCIWLFCQYLCDKYTFLLWIWAPQGPVMWVCSLPIKIRKRLAHGAKYTSCYTCWPCSLWHRFSLTVHTATFWV